MARKRETGILILVPSLILVSQALPAKGTAIPETVSAINASRPLGQRVVAYDIDASYDPKTHSLEGTQRLTYRNLSGRPLDCFPFHVVERLSATAAGWRGTQEQSDDLTVVVIRVAAEQGLIPTEFRID